MGACREQRERFWAVLLLRRELGRDGVQSVQACQKDPGQFERLFSGALESRNTVGCADT
jgi:hypothetical protein